MGDDNRRHALTARRRSHMGMDADAKKEIDALISEVDAILADFESGMRALTERQRAAIIKAAAAVDGKRLEKVKKLIDTLYA